MLVTESEDAGGSSRATAEFGVSLLAAALSSHLSDATVVRTSSDGYVDGLADWLDELHLGDYISKANGWCQQQGAVELQEVLENASDFSQSLGLRPAEDKRLEASARHRLGLGPAPTPGGELEASAGDTAESEESAEPESPVADLEDFEIAEDEDDGIHRFASYPCAGEKEEARQYTLLEQLSCGATAKVHRCLNGLGQEFAVKTVTFDERRRRSADYQHVAEMLYQEVTILLSMQHPHVVSLFDVVEESDSLRMVMELIKGGDLMDRLLAQPNCRFEEVQAKLFFAQIADGLKYIHFKRIVHRDLKPDNILVDKDDQVRISDFGHSRFVDGVGSANERVGTLLYMAPEALDSALAVEGFEQSCDLWSLGVILYLMLVGRTPFGGINVEEQIVKASFTFPALTDDGHMANPDAQDLVRALVVVEPTQRLALQWCLKHKWITTAADRLQHVLQLSNEAGPEALEERYQLPRSILAVPHKLLRRDLQHWTVKFRFSAIATRTQVILNYGDKNQIKQEVVDIARRELRALMRYHFGVVLRRSRPRGQSEQDATRRRSIQNVAAQQDVERIREIIEECRTEGMEGLELDGATTVLERKEMKVRARTELQDAIVARSLERLKSALELGEVAGLEQAELVEGRQVLLEEEEKLEAWSILKTTMSSEDTSGLEAVLERCAQAGLPAEDLEGARRLLVEYQHEADSIAPRALPTGEAKSRLATACQQRDAAQLASALRAARRSDLPRHLVARAEEQLRDLPSESQARQHRLEARRAVKANMKWNFTGQSGRSR